MSDTAARTLFDRIWDRHRVLERPDGLTLPYVDAHLVHDGSAPAFRRLHRRGLAVRPPPRPARTWATPDHDVPTDVRPGAHDVAAIGNDERRGMVEQLVANTTREGVTLFRLEDPRQGIVHVVGPEQGSSQPGALLVRSDSHTSTHGAVGALGFGIGSSEVEHMPATQTLWQRKPRSRWTCQARS